MIRLYPARTAEELEHARILLLESASRDVDLEELPGHWAPPRGRILLAEWNGLLAGCVALKPFADPSLCRVERLYVRPAHRKRGLGRALLTWAVDEARAIGYERARSDGDGAIYRALGFVGGELALSTRPR